MELEEAPMPPAPPNEPVVPPAYWSLSSEQLLAILPSAPEGLSAAEAARHLAQVGPNLLETRSQVTGLNTFLRQFSSPITLILLVATLISAVLGDWTDTVIILVIILGSATLSSIQEYRATTAAEKLRAQVRVQATVLRDGCPQTIPVAQVVPGD